MRKQSVLTTEEELNDKLDELYCLSNNNSTKGFEGLLEIVISKPTIIKAIHRAYVFNRDNGRCKYCKIELQTYEVEIHHINPKLSLNEVNQAKNLITLCEKCHKAIHAKYDLDSLDKLTAKKIKNIGNRLQLTN